HLVVLLEGGLRALEKADVFLVDVDVDEAADLTAFLHQPFPHARELTLQILDQVADRVGRHLDVGRALGHRPQGSGDAHTNSHPGSPCLAGPGSPGLGFSLLNTRQSAMSTTALRGPGFNFSTFPLADVPDSAPRPVVKNAMFGKSKPDPVVYHRQP